MVAFLVVCWDFFLKIKKVRAFKKKHVPRPEKGPSVPLDRLKPPFDLEIGCGSGEFAIQWARQTKNPVIAIEKTRRRFSAFEKKRKDWPPNLWPIHTNAVWWLTHYSRKSSFEHIFLLYPNPYPKNRGAHLRWINRPFMPFLLDRLIPGGCLELRSNRPFFYREFKEKIKSFPFMRKIEEKLLKDPSLSQSLFEKKYLERGEECLILKYQKIFPPVSAKLF